MGEIAVPFPGEAAERQLQNALNARPRGLFSDVDGTLSALAPTPEAAVLLPGVVDLLPRVAAVFEVVAAVSGRAASDTRRMVGVPGLLYIGNHGLERLSEVGDAATVMEAPEAQPYVAAIARALEELQQRLAPALPGIRFEAKGMSASIHVRGTSDPETAEAAVYAAALEAATPYGLRVTRGKRVVELRPPVAVDKGVVVAQVVRERGVRGALYLGDDHTDLDAFRALRRLRAEGICHGVSIAVLHAEAPAELSAEADVALASVAVVPTFLRWVVERAGQRC
jgi:trehalose 6-phosphate phosphatase